MDRKQFLGSASALSVAAAMGKWPEESGKPFKEESNPLMPPYLKKGDLIGITAPAGYISIEEIEPAVSLIKSLGYEVKTGATIGKKNFTFAGTDEERLNDFQQMLDDRSIKAILCARGGYGLIRIIDRIKWQKLKLHPKWIIGFSDITVIHSHLNRNVGIASIHSKMCNSFPTDWNNAEAIQVETINSIQKALSGEKMIYKATSNLNNQLGMSEGILVGGNLKTLETMAGSSSDIKTSGKILFVEDTGEYMYSIDRMFWNLKRSGKLSNLSGLIIGGFKPKVDADSEDFGMTLEQIVMEKIKDKKYPVCFDFPVGHQKNNFALKCGVKHKLAVRVNESTLTETK